MENKITVSLLNSLYLAENEGEGGSLVTAGMLMMESYESMTSFP